MTAYLIDGIDALGKSTLIKNIQQKLGYHLVLHYSKPVELEYYGGDTRAKLYEYQRSSFYKMFQVIEQCPNVPIICDRTHLGEYVYGALYRKYDGFYSLEIENYYKTNNIKLILLLEDFTCSKHFVDDGESFDITKRKQEQELFGEAFSKSVIKDKKMVFVTDPKTGGFRDQKDILREALYG